MITDAMIDAAMIALDGQTHNRDRWRSALIAAERAASTSGARRPITGLLWWKPYQSTGYMMPSRARGQDTGWMLMVGQIEEWGARVDPAWGGQAILVVNSRIIHVPSVEEGKRIAERMAGVEPIGWRCSR